jgi:hypothetical protein
MQHLHLQEEAGISLLLQEEVGIVLQVLHREAHPATLAHHLVVVQEVLLHQEEVEVTEEGKNNIHEKNIFSNFFLGNGFNNHCPDL